VPRILSSTPWCLEFSLPFRISAWVSKEFLVLMRAASTFSHETHFLHPNNNWRVRIYESLPNVIFSILLLLPLPPCHGRKYFSQHTLVHNSPTIFLSWNETTEFYNFLHSFSFVTRIWKKFEAFNLHFQSEQVKFPNYFMALQSN